MAVSGTIGMLYVVEVRMVDKITREKIKHKVLIVGGEERDIERKMRWVFDSTRYSETSITGIEKIRDKVHILQTIITQDSPAVTPIIRQGERTESVPQGKTIIEDAPLRLFAVGVSTRMPARDSVHALRKVGHAIVSSTLPDKSHSGASLSDDATITVEEIPFASGYARPRDVSNENNPAHFVRG
jgi:hypothetical protein